MNLLLTKKEIEKAWKSTKPNETEFEAVAKVQLIHAEPLIRKDERAKIRNSPELKKKMGDLISGFVNRRSFTLRDLNQVMALLGKE